MGEIKEMWLWWKFKKHDRRHDRSRATSTEAERFEWFKEFERMGPEEVRAKLLHDEIDRRIEARLAKLSGNGR